MEIDEIIKNLKKLKSFHNGSYGTAINFAIKALEQQSSEDCISRESLRQLICKNNDKYGYSDRFHEFAKECLQLPSVTPKAKTGHWIDIMVGDMQAQACDQCKTFYPLAYTGGGHRFCPNCGAKMEVKE